MKNKIVAVIPARGGSRGIPRKNIKTFAGKPLIAHIIETANNVPELDRIIVSTEDNEIANIAKKYGAEVPFIRPEALAKDETPTLPVLQHTVRYLESEEKYTPTIIALLYATSPLLSYTRISEAIKMIGNNDYDSIMGVIEDRGHYWIKENNYYTRLYPKVVVNRQFAEPLLKDNGALYLSRRDLLMSENLMVGGKIGYLRMKREESIDIDDPLDFKIAEFLMEHR